MTLAYSFCCRLMMIVLKIVHDVGTKVGMSRITHTHTHTHTRAKEKTYVHCPSNWIGAHFDRFIHHKSYEVLCVVVSIQQQTFVLLQDNDKESCEFALSANLSVGSALSAMVIFSLLLCLPVLQHNTQEFMRRSNVCTVIVGTTNYNILRIVFSFIIPQGSVVDCVNSMSKGFVPMCLRLRVCKCVPVLCS